MSSGYVNGVFYICDPQKYARCSKDMCHRLDGCYLTTQRDYALSGTEHIQVYLIMSTVGSSIQAGYQIHVDGGVNAGPEMYATEDEIREFYGQWLRDPATAISAFIQMLGEHAATGAGNQSGGEG